jgi:Zinc carboxypeptidase
MRNKFVLIISAFCGILFLHSNLFSQTKSPFEYFGYEFGNTFHRHHQMVEYMSHLVANNPSQTKIIDYGKTTEGRKLFIIAISSAENIAQLEQIRQNNLKSIGLLDGNTTQKKPALTWLSYNVHGNEAVSMEASMEVLYKLLKNKDGESNKAFKETVIFIDPCINPDGRDRYANWYNQKLGIVPNADPIAIEHSEPWPSGRPNHYLFDLNRDWAWLVQDESTQRLALYNSWMPHLHADFHEQGVNSPYYFAPAAKPYHEEITQWQREFQQKMGEYNKKEFDKNGWLYFSGERFDLLYPSYGDTYPTFNGAIGMTYEQGGIRAGLAYAKLDGDTLTLKQRISHHVASSFASINAMADNSEKIVDEFVKFFQKSISNPDGAYQTFIVKTKGDETKIEEFTQHLNKLGIKYNTVGKALVANGFCYSDRKFKGFSIDPTDLILSMNQPKSKLMKVLMEPQTLLEDSLTYDITAWALPYAYGLNAFALKEKLVGKIFESKKVVNTLEPIKLGYAYFLKWNSFTDTKVLTELLKLKIKVRQAEIPFEIEGKSFERGTLVITRTSNEALGAKLEGILTQIANQYNVPLSKSSTGMVAKGFDMGSDKVVVINAPKIAIISGEPTDANAFGEVWHFFEKQLGYPATIVNADFLNNNNFVKFDVIILPDGNYNRVVYENTTKALADWVRAGGKLILMQKANNTFVDKAGFEIKRKDPKKDSLINTKTYENRERDEIGNETPGSIHSVTMDNSHPLAFGYGKSYASLVLEATDFLPLKSGWNVGLLKENSLLSGFVGKAAKEKLKGSLAFGVENLGKGNVVYMINNPLFRGFWQNGKLLFCNAVFGTY